MWISFTKVKIKGKMAIAAPAKTGAKNPANKIVPPDFMEDIPDTLFHFAYTLAHEGLLADAFIFRPDDRQFTTSSESN